MQEAWGAWSLSQAGGQRARSQAEVEPDGEGPAEWPSVQQEQRVPRLLSGLSRG